MRGILDESGAQLVVLGKGEARYEEFFRQLEAEYPDRVRALITYDRDLSKKIYAAADIFMMPSKSEPCGLSQMIASRYGAIPVVRETGGLADSILPYWEDADGAMHGNGFTFAGYTAGELYERTLAAVALWKNGEKRKAFPSETRYNYSCCCTDTCRRRHLGLCRIMAPHTQGACFRQH
jgi:starch synthase